MQVFSRRNLKKCSLQKSKTSEQDVKERILKTATRLFARRGYEGTTTKDLASQAKVAEGTLFRYFPNKKAILIEVATAGWIDILTDLLTELSEMGDCKAISQVMKKRMLNMHANADLLKVCFFEAQYHPELREKIQSEVVIKMTGVAEAFFETAMEKGIYFWACLRSLDFLNRPLSILMLRQRLCKKWLKGLLISFYMVC